MLKKCFQFDTVDVWLASRTVHFMLYLFLYLNNQGQRLGAPIMPLLP